MTEATHEKNSEWYGRDELSSAEMRELLEKTREIHAFITGIGTALNSPMFKSILPPQLRAMLGD